jgi:protein TonB
VVTLPQIEPQPEWITIDEPVLERSVVTLPPQPRPVDLDQHDDAVITAHETVEPPAAGHTEPAAHQPLIVQPSVDPRIGLSEPAYPPQELRLGHAGTVILAVQILENGRVGSVRVEQSSGFPRLDDAAVRQAARWQLSPGTRDGVPIVMWKRIPITFRLRE